MIGAAGGIVLLQALAEAPQMRRAASGTIYIRPARSRRKTGSHNRVGVMHRTAASEELFVYISHVQEFRACVSSCFFVAR